MIAEGASTLMEHALHSPAPWKNNTADDNKDSDDVFLLHVITEETRWDHKVTQRTATSWL